MFFRNLLLLLLFVGFIISAAPRQSSADSASKLSETPDIVKALFPSNASIPPLDTSAENIFIIRCDGETYGYNPNIRDCEGAKEKLVPDTKIWTLAERRPDLPVDTVPLPYRVMGNRGLCYVEPVLIGDHTSAKASLNMIRQAASALVLQCAVGITSQGGIATNIGKTGARIVVYGLLQSHILTCMPWLAPTGGDNNLAVTLGTYQKPASCHKPLPSYESCRHLLYTMPADKIPQVFGPGSDPAVTEELPLSILSR